jgi:hypothetical protein
MKNIVDQVLQACSHDAAPGFANVSRDRLRCYIEMLASVGKNDVSELETYGRAYLKQLRNPDRRYTGC